MISKRLVPSRSLKTLLLRTGLMWEQRLPITMTTMMVLSSCMGQTLWPLLRLFFPLCSRTLANLLSSQEHRWTCGNIFRSSKMFVIWDNSFKSQPLKKCWAEYRYNVAFKFVHRRAFSYKSLRLFSIKVEKQPSLENWCVTFADYRLHLGLNRVVSRI